jgi:hypothetical protein
MTISKLLFATGSTLIIIIVSLVIIPLLSTITTTNSYFIPISLAKKIDIAT